MCDVAYVLRVEQLDQRTLAEWQSITLRGGELPDLGVLLAEQRAAFDEMLAAEPMPATVDNSEQARMRRALGVA